MQMSKEILQVMYCKEQMPIVEIAKVFGISVTDVINKLQEYGMLGQNKSSKIGLKKMRKLSREQVQPVIFMFAGAIFAIISLLMAFSTLIASEQIVPMVGLLVIAGGLFYYGWNMLKKLKGS